MQRHRLSKSLQINTSNIKVLNELKIFLKNVSLIKNFSIRAIRLRITIEHSAFLLRPRDPITYLPILRITNGQEILAWEQTKHDVVRHQISPPDVGHSILGKLIKSRPAKSKRCTESLRGRSLESLLRRWGPHWWVGPEVEGGGLQ